MTWGKRGLIWKGRQVSEQGKKGSVMGPIMGGIGIGLLFLSLLTQCTTDKYASQARIERERSGAEFQLELARQEGERHRMELEAALECRNAAEAALLKQITERD